MKSLKSIKFPMLLLSLSVFLWGCATASSTSGRDFDSSLVSQIEKGKTTSDRISTMFGIPNSKQPEANGEERWIYSYITVTAHAQSDLLLGMNTTTKGTKKILNILFNKDMIVDNFTFDEGPVPSRTINAHQY